MKVHLEYGKTGLSIDMPDDATVLERQEAPSITDEAAALRQALRQPIGTKPLRELAQGNDRVAIVFSDITRPMPNDRVLSVLLNELSHIPRNNILLINALGSHRANTPAELEQMLGAEIVNNCRILQHDAWDDANLVTVGKSVGGYPLEVNRHYLEADVRILTGFVEPHFFAGFSGGPKAVLPGVAGIRTIMGNHGYKMVADPGATWLEKEQNPIYEEIERTALLTKPNFLLNVTISRERGISGVFAGDMLAAHASACDFVRKSARVTVSQPFDVVVTSNSGYPLDLNLYQAVKGMSAAARIVRPGGTILMVAECWDGLPAHGRYAELLHSVSSPEALLARICSFPETVQDQWQAQVQAQIQAKADVYLYTNGLNEEQIRQALFLPCRDIAMLVAQLIREKGPRVAVMPEGPFVVPTLAG